MRVTSTLTDRQADAVQELIHEQGVSAAEAIRQIVDEWIDDTNETERLQARVDELTEQLRVVNRKENKAEQLAVTADKHTSAVERMIIEQQRRRSAGVVKRARWWLLGDPKADTELDE